MKASYFLFLIPAMLALSPLTAEQAPSAPATSTAPAAAEEQADDNATPVAPAAEAPKAEQPKAAKPVAMAEKSTASATNANSAVSTQNQKASGTEKKEPAKK